MDSSDTQKMSLSQSQYNRDHSFKLDEFLIDETRSLDDGDSAMGLEPRSGDTFPRVLTDPLLTLNEAAIGLTETQRTGM